MTKRVRMSALMVRRVPVMCVWANRLKVSIFPAESKGALWMVALGAYSISIEFAYSFNSVTARGDSSSPDKYDVLWMRRSDVKTTSLSVIV